MAVERHLSLSNGDLPDLNAALAWAVGAFDVEFTKATMVKISVEQVATLRSDSDVWTYPWTASVSGLIEESSTDGR
jgi:hypothetical protein